jgi:hypothetical protein
MANDVAIVKTVFNTTEFNKVISTAFSTFTQPTSAQNTDTPEELFRLYNELYFTIDVMGDKNSHEYLVKKSSELLNFNATTQDIQPLLDEIAQLRQQNLDLNQQIVAIQTKIA